MNISQVNSAAVTAPLTTVTSKETVSVIAQIQKINEISSAYSKNTLIFFDIDDTLFDSPYLLGSRGWRRYIVEATKNTGKNWHDIFSYFIAQNVPSVAIEGSTVQLVKELQTQGIGVCALTARERKVWYSTPTEGVDLLTSNQLKAAGFEFDQNAHKRLYPDLVDNPEYFGGIFFADTELKGEYLKKILGKASQKPTKIIFVDDKIIQVESVASALKELGIDHECYWYCATDDKAKKFNPLISNIQLYHLWISKGQKIISDKEAEEIAKAYPEKDADYYLRETLMFKDNKNV